MTFDNGSTRTWDVWRSYNSSRVRPAYSRVLWPGTCRANGCGWPVVERSYRIRLLMEPLCEMEGCEWSTVCKDVRSCNDGLQEAMTIPLCIGDDDVRG